ncbi:sialidase family protein [Plantactinospora sp. KLBMP9567]|uniref:sialidase family protein n=1 Tax=Plantactinospora sp. KLBMP9567 TaxID=3085900 RepID=UPI0029826F07|nr:sialidase family protein [Plantactinospora sp. KLBMP9567]MDW5328007.1 sialidase family protein [Plantactinospora sp. KLBMP9567]
MSARTHRRSRLSQPAIATSCAVLVATLTGASAPSVAADRTPAGDTARCEVSTPFTSGTEGYNGFRIPAIMTTRSGALLAFAEGRLSSLGDAGNIDLVLKRSTDGGCTWGPLQVVNDSGPNTAGNPAPVLTATGRVVLLTTYNGGEASEAEIMRGEVPAEQSRRVFVQYSDDEGARWSAPREITGQTKAGNWRWYATGPGHAVRLTRGPHRDRLVVPANHSVAPPAGSPDLGTEAKYYGGHALYSDDGGESWRIGFVDDNTDGYLNVNESTAAELPDGRLYLNTREHNGTAPGNRADAYSRDGGQSLELPYRPQATLVGPVVQASVLQLSGSHAPLLFSGPAEPTGRAALTLRVSTDHGATWRPALALSGLPAGYSDLVQLDARTVGVLYETGNFGPYETITFRRIAIREL